MSELLVYPKYLSAHKIVYNFASDRSSYYIHFKIMHIHIQTTEQKSKKKESNIFKLDNYTTGRIKNGGGGKPSMRNENNIHRINRFYPENI